MKVEIVTDITEEPVSLAETKAFLRVTGSGHDTVISSLITAARQTLESRTDSSFGVKSLKVTTTEDLKIYDPDDDINVFADSLLPYGPVSDVTQSDDDDYYYYEYTAGYETLPYPLRTAIMMLVKYWYDIDEVSRDVPASIDAIVDSYNRNPML